MEDGENQRARRWGSSLQIALSLLAGSLLTLLVVVLFGSRFISVSVPPVPTQPISPATPVPGRTATPVPTLTPMPTPTPTPKIITGPEVIRQIRQVSRLETTSYSVQTVVTVERPGNFIGVGRQRLLVVVHGTVVAGIDLAKLREQDVTISDGGKRIVVQLPPAEILSRFLDESSTEVYDHQTGLFTKPDTSLVLEAQKAGADQVLQTACQDGILQRATRDGQRSIEQVLTLVGFEVIEFEETATPACPSPDSPTPAATPKS
jgi:hypothetical protein